MKNDGDADDKKAREIKPPTKDRRDEIAHKGAKGDGQHESHKHPCETVGGTGGKY